MTIRFSLYLPDNWSKSRPMRWFSSYKHGKVGEYKAWEWQTDYFGWNQLFSFDLDLVPTGSDHAGIGFSITLLGFMVDAKIYDSRHWDRDAGTWEDYDTDAQLRREDKATRDRAEELDWAYHLVKQNDNQHTRMDVEAYLASPMGQRHLDRLVDIRLKERQDSKDAKAARGEAYRRANLGLSGNPDL